ncbi:hypothetical protein [Roseococcus sp.]
MTEDKHVLTATEARQGTTPNIVRWVLIGGLVLVIPALGVAWYLTAG